MKASFVTFTSAFDPFDPYMHNISDFLDSVICQGTFWYLISSYLLHTCNRLLNLNKVFPDSVKCFKDKYQLDGKRDVDASNDIKDYYHALSIRHWKWVEAYLGPCQKSMMKHFRN